ncbi:hypothetical protein MLD38_010213 [Melastoma candidum]|uniref:Uncharacterized protein n=1 Tax=Melastoma candidum TaxID=119954 RepID=A0ACB9R071_9MYRT|nr:hypothetical protein MLD38_010213 [Melastoma candidum]
MLEKIGLPAKPSLRGNNWVVDASHCQGCASPFTFINRKHHCRRCGGLFCNNCTIHRMVLRGQGDSPVRICEPCKKLVEAERLELRLGQRNRAGQGRSKMTSNVPNSEDEILTQILSSDVRTSSSARPETTKMDRTTSIESSSSNLEDTSLEGRMETGSVSPDDLRRQASDEKKRYKILKGEGKPEEALKAFKKGKELERQADALQLSLRKVRRKNANVIQMENIEPDQARKPYAASRDKGKDDLLSELRHLGWSDQDLHSADKKPETMSLEGELSTLIRDINQKPSDTGSAQCIERSEVTAHKRKALMLKREGKLTEAKEELKKAKLLERQIEEQELLGGAEDSDDELSALMRSVNAERGEELLVKQDRDFHADDLIVDGQSMVVDGNFDVTDEDLHDPKIAADLKSIGWIEESDDSELSGQPTIPGRMVPSSAFLEEEVMGKRDTSVPLPAPTLDVDQSLSSAGGLPRRSKAEIQRELLGLKRKALTLRREGKTEEAEEMLAAAKLLEAQIADMEAPKTRSGVEVHYSLERLADTEDGDDITENDLQDPSLLSMLKDLGWNEEPGMEHDGSTKRASGFLLAGENATRSASGRSTAAPRSKAKIQREILGLKRKALDLRRKGEMEEAEKVLATAKELEAEMEEMELRKADDGYVNGNSDNLTRFVDQETYGDMESAKKIIPQPASRDREPLMADLIGVGEAVGKQSTEEGKNASFILSECDGKVDFLTGNVWSDSQVSNNRVDDEPSSTPPLPSTISNLHGSKKIIDPSCGAETTQVDDSSSISTGNVTLLKSKSLSVEQDILAIKKKAVAFKREGKIAEAREELKRAKLLERSLQNSNALLIPSVPSSTAPTNTSEEHEPIGLDSKPILSSRERFKIQQESLAHKRQALKLRKEGRIQEAESELELAKALEAQLEESAPQESGRPSKGGTDEVVVEDLLDPDLLSALKAIGMADPGSIVSQERPGPSKTITSSRDDSPAQERARLEEQIRAEKLKAVRLKRAGKQAEALDSLRQAKMMEKKLNSLGLE